MIKRAAPRAFPLAACGLAWAVLFSAPNFGAEAQEIQGAFYNSSQVKLRLTLPGSDDSRRDVCLDVDPETLKSEDLKLELVDEDSVRDLDWLSWSRAGPRSTSGCDHEDDEDNGRDWIWTLIFHSNDFIGDHREDIDFRFFVLDEDGDSADAREITFTVDSNGLGAFGWTEFLLLALALAGALAWGGRRKARARPERVLRY